MLTTMLSPAEWSAVRLTAELAALSTLLIGVSIIVALVMIFGTKFYKVD